ncbi:MAG: hypothetical protein FIB02_07880 [Desulfuromonas sp.]|nr:hypothetical protein [Desulfuromonas sp.]
MPNDNIENTKAAAQTIICPYCDYERQVPLDKLPARPVAATCPNCRSRFMFRPAATSSPPEANPSNRGQDGLGKPRYRNDFDIIRDELVSFYADVISRQKSNVLLVGLLLVLYGLMYFIVTSIYYMYIKSSGGPVAEVAEYLLVASSYVAFFPAMVMHSWKFIDAGSSHLVDRLFSYKSIFFLVTTSYALLLTVYAGLFGGSPMPLALLFPVIVSSLVPSLLHILSDSL